MSGAMPDNYDLPHLSFQEQATQLANRGLVVDDPAAAERWLERIGYYRLRPYWMALRSEGEAFLPGATLAYAVDLYRFDLALRQCLLAGLERIEVSLRVQVSHAIGRRDVIGHRKLACLDGTKFGRHADWLTKADMQISECREQWLDDFYRDFAGEVPTWMAVEAWSFGIVSKLYSIMNRNDRAAIARHFTVNHETFASWMRAAATLRNTCAHHGRVWNKPLIDQPAVPKSWEAKEVQHVEVTRKSQTRVYAMLAVMAHCLKAIGSGKAWAKSTRTLALAFPEACGLSVKDAGFPDNWDKEALWL